jgi:DNA-binding response OmpR family regulator
MTGRSFHGERILLVEDNPRLLRSMAFLLHVIGFEVMTACDGIEALELLRMRTPDIILSDIDMPYLDGYELLRQVRLDVRWSKIPFIFASDKYSLDDLMYALDLGADDYLPKPFDIHDVLEVIERALPAPTIKHRRMVS